MCGFSSDIMRFLDCRSHVPGSALLRLGETAAGSEAGDDGGDGTGWFLWNLL